MWEDETGTCAIIITAWHQQNPIGAYIFLSLTPSCQGHLSLCCMLVSLKPVHY